MHKMIKAKRKIYTKSDKLSLFIFAPSLQLSVIYNALAQNRIDKGDSLFQTFTPSSIKVAFLLFEA